MFCVYMCIDGTNLKFNRTYLVAVHFELLTKIYVYRSPAFSQFLAKCLVKDPHSRPSAAELFRVNMIR